MMRPWLLALSSVTRKLQGRVSEKSKFPKRRAAGLRAAEIAGNEKK